MHKEAGAFWKNSSQMQLQQNKGDLSSTKTHEITNLFHEEAAPYLSYSTQHVRPQRLCTGAAQRGISSIGRDVLWELVAGPTDRLRA